MSRFNDLVTQNSHAVMRIWDRWDEGQLSDTERDQLIDQNEAQLIMALDAETRHIEMVKKAANDHLRDLANDTVRRYYDKRNIAGIVDTIDVSECV